MTEVNKLINLLNAYIEHLFNNYEKNNPLDLDEKMYSFWNNKFNLILNDFNELSNLNIDDLKKDLQINDENILILLLYYQVIIRDTTFELGLDDRNKINEIISNLRNLVSEKIVDINNLKINRENEKNKLVEPYLLIVKKLKNNNRLNSDDVRLIYDVIKLSNQGINDSIRIMQYIFNESFNKKEIEDEIDEEIIILEDTNLEIDELSNLFYRYNIDFNKFKEGSRNELRIKGNLSKIEEILKVFSKYGVNISLYLEDRSGAISKILLYSNDKLVENLFEELINYGILNRSAIDFASLLENPSVFLSRRKKYIKKKNDNDTKLIDRGDVDFNNKNDKRITVSGCQEDLFKNLKYFSNLISNIADAYNGCKTAFYQPHDKILNDIKMFYLYGIDEKYYLNTLTCFFSPNVGDTIDMFIELEQFNYLINNMSRIYNNSSSLMFYKLARARQLGKSPEMYGNNFSGLITNDDREYLGIERIEKKVKHKRISKKHNGKEITEQYEYEFDAKGIYEDIIKNSACNTYIKVLEEEGSLIKLMDSHYIDKFENGYPNNRLYNINGVLFSRIKFLRIYNTLIMNGIEPSLDSIIYALTRNSIITKEQFDMVYNNVKLLYLECEEKRGVRRK